MRAWHWAALFVAALLSPVVALSPFVLPHIMVIKTTVAAGPTPGPTPTKSVPVPTPTPQASCLRAGAVSQPYANDPGKSGPKSFGPPVSPSLGLAAVNLELRLRLCGRPGHGPDERLWAAIDAAANGTADPNVRVPNATWARSVSALVDSQILWDKTELVVKRYGPQARTLDMTPGTFPRIGLSQPGPRSDTFLRLPVVQGGLTAYLTLRLKCGFQPYFAAPPDVPANLG